MLTIFGTALVRTTHVTGLVTDVGILVGLYLRDLIIARKVRKEGMWKLKIMVPLYLGFFGGGSLGYIALSHISGTYPLIIPALVVAWIAVGFVYLRHIHKAAEKKKTILEARKMEQQRIEEEELQQEMRNEAEGMMEDEMMEGEGEGEEGGLDDVELDDKFPSNYGAHDRQNIYNGTKS